MTNLTSFGVLNQKVREMKEADGFDTFGFAFVRLALQVVLKINDDELEDAITDGPMDGEVDAVYINARTAHIFTAKYTNDFKNTGKNYPETELDQFIVSLHSILSGSLDVKTINTAVWDKYVEISSLCNEGPVNFKIYIISNKLKPVEHSRKKLENVLNKFKFVEVFYLDQEDLVNLIIENKAEKINGKVRLIEYQHFEKSDGSIKTIIGSIAATDLIEMIRHPKDRDTVNNDIFNENVRIYKPQHRVNKAIIDSALDENSYRFFYLNNGITILCEECDYTPNMRSPVVPLRNLQIINGCQTSNSLFKAYLKDSKKIDRIELLIRICVAKKENPISDMISESTNSQIPVGNRDLHSNDLVQKKLQQEFETLGYYYERKPNQFSDKPKDKVLNNELLGQIFMAYELDMPSEAKNSKALVFSDRYDDIFDDMIITAEKLLKIQNIYLPLLKMKKVIQAKKRKRESINEKEAFISRGTFHILNAIKLILEDRISTIKKKCTNQDEREATLKKLFEREIIDPIISEAISDVGEVVDREMKKRGDTYTHDKFFKEVPTNKLIRDHVLSKLTPNL
jgi:hypothetical protein